MSPVLAALRELDPDRYLATLFAPADRQADLAALYVFSAEIARIRALVKEPGMGEIRFQWWREVLGGARRDEAAANPSAAALLETIAARRLPTQPLVDLIDARTFDLYDDPMPTWLDLEGYAGETASALFRLASLTLSDAAAPGAADAAGHAGVAYALTGLMRAFPWTSRRGQVYLPLELLDTHRVTPSAIRRGEDGKGLRAALAETRQRARSHLDAARRSIAALPADVRAAYLPLALVERYLRAMDARGYDPYRSEIAAGKLAKLWDLWRASQRGVA